MRLLLAGASGVIGGALARSLAEDGHDVRRLVRRPPSSSEETSWDPAQHRLDESILTGIDAVICMSGANVGDHRWTAAYRNTIRASRVDSVATLAQALVQAKDGPRTFLVASGIGYYGDHGDTPIDEQTPNGLSFFGQVCRDWEAAAAPANAAGIRVAYLRSGLVLAPGEGILARLAPLFRLGVGGRLGNGRQYWPWISLSDEIAAIQFVLTNGDIAGPVNLTGPNPVTNAEFATTLGELLHRPALLPVPRFALRIALDGFATEILSSQRALPAKLTSAGFDFKHTELRAALRYALAS